MEKIAIIGAGISGLSVAQLLKDKYHIKVFEKENNPGGLIRCKRINDSLFHLCGGHVFNSKRTEVLDWFWKFFDREKEFQKAERNSVVYLKGDKIIPYPIENHVYMFSDDVQMKFIQDLLKISENSSEIPTNFEEFLRGRFGETLYEIYFKPYNEKIWKRDLTKVPLVWLEGKLPMPTVNEMIYNNFNHIEEKQFVHSSFWYERQNGSQLIADRLAENLDIQYDSDIRQIKKDRNKWIINSEVFDKIIFCGSIKQMPELFANDDIINVDYCNAINALEYHGTTAVFCEIEKNPYSWIYMPSSMHNSHRIICTGNFSKTNNANGKMTASIEFTDEISKEDIMDNLSRIPFKPKYLYHHYNPCTYPIQSSDTRKMIGLLKDDLSKKNIFMTGRFADWEYYNMDISIGAAMDMIKKYNL